MDYIKIYSDFLKKFLEPERKLKVVFDCSNGVAGLILKELFKTNLLINYELINHIPDGNFPAHGPNPSKKGALNDLRSAVLKNKADLGAIFDADADRAFFIDNRGRFIDPDIIARLLIWQLKPKKTVIDIRAGWLVKKRQASSVKCQVSDVKSQVSKVGHLYIKKLMRKIKADFGAERSGHYYFKISDTNTRIHTNDANKSELNKNTLYYDSGILATIETINAVSRLPYSLADFNDLLPQYYRSGEINIRDANLQIHANAANNLLKKIERYFKSQNTKYKILNTNYLDGLTMEFVPSASSGQAWWFNLRPSNTEPLIRLNVEALTKKTLNNSVKKIVRFLSIINNLIRR